MDKKSLIKIEEMSKMPTQKLYTLPSLSKQPHKPKLTKEYGCPNALEKKAKHKIKF